MKQIKHRLASECLNTDETMRDVLDHIRVLHRLNRCVQSALDASFRTHCLLLDYEKGILKIAVDHSSTATRLRYQLSDLQQTLSRTPEFSDLQSIVYRIKPELFEQPNTPSPRKPYFSQTIAHDLRALANEISDEGLKAALQRLSKNAIKD